ncbi:MAG TPA: VacB/RNase II family 3'-5' exoribonuclease [Polyangiaceae bacterium]|nr:VacB/RNase II family 3'-5' exoribonuclease [Polyangiaceae bacterium]
MASRIPAKGEVIRMVVEAKKPIHPRELAAQLGVSMTQLPKLVAALDELADQKRIKRLNGGRYTAELREVRQSESWEGVLSLNPRGFGFVNAVGHDDLYIAPEAIGPALHGDRVKVTVVNRSSRGAEGRVDHVVARRNPRVAGVLRRRGKSVWLEPDDSRLRGPIVLSNTSKLGEDGDAAVAEITRFPDFPDENPEGELITVLGSPGDPNVEVAKILIREQVTEQHPEGAIREAEAMAVRLLPLNLSGRVDLRSVPLPTIDPEDARDHDDAVWVEKHGDGFRAWIAIADVSEYVQPGSELDKEALRRGCTIYLPDRAIPMLPAALAADLCSLLAEKERLCLCVIADLDRDGKVKTFEIVEGVMRSAAMLTYGGVARTLGFTDLPPKSAPAEAFKKELRVMEELTKKLRKARMSRGSLDLDLPEAKLTLDPVTKAPIDVTRRTSDPGIKRAYNMIEELMLLANELVATWLGSKGSPAIYRVHGKPDPQKLARLGLVAEKLGVEFDAEAMSEPLGVSKFLQRISTHARKQVLEMLLLRSLKQAAYDVKNVGHFGLASTNYLHFTSPIRRYPDVQVHRAVKHLLRGEKPISGEAALEELAQSATSASVRERAAMDVEREVVDLYRCLLMRDHIGETCEGVVTALVGSGAYVTLDTPFVDVLVKHESMGPDHYEMAEDELSVVGARSGDTVSLGDRIAVVIEDVAILRRQVLARRVVPDEVLKTLEDGEGFEAPESAGKPQTRAPGRRGAGPRVAARGRGVPLLKVGHRPVPTRKGAAKPTTGGGKSYKPGRGGKPVASAGPSGKSAGGGKSAGAGKSAGGSKSGGRSKKRR